MADDRNTFGHLIDVTLSEAEIKAQLERNADIDRKIIAVSGQKALAARGYNDDLKLLRKEQETLLSTISTGKTKLEVECYLERDDRRGIMFTLRNDNGEIVDQRALTADELNEDRQGSLFEGDKKPAGPDDASGDEDEEEQHDSDLDETLAAYQAQQAANGEGESTSAAPVDEEGDEDDDLDEDTGVEARPH